MLIDWRFLGPWLSAWNGMTSLRSIGPVWRCYAVSGVGVVITKFVVRALRFRSSNRGWGGLFGTKMRTSKKFQLSGCWTWRLCHADWKSQNLDAQMREVVCLAQRVSCVSGRSGPCLSRWGYVCGNRGLSFLFFHDWWKRCSQFPSNYQRILFT